MKTVRFKKLPWYLAGTYLVWSLFVYFGSLGSEAHSWWPLFLYPLIWPWSWVERLLIDRLLTNWLAPDPKSAPESVWMLMDYLGGAFYIVVGTLWFWFLGKTVSLVSRRSFPLDGEATKQDPKP